MLMPAGYPLASEFDIINDIGGDKDELPTSSVGQLFFIRQTLSFFVHN